MSSIYQEIILDHYRAPRNNTHLSNPSASIAVSNPLCGDKLVMEIIEENGVITDIGFTGQGCAISQASASLLTEYVKGKTKDNLLKLDKDFILNMLGIELSPNRLKCALLSLEALKKILNINS